MTKLWSQKLHISPRLTNMGSTIGHRKDYNGVGALRPAAHTQQKLTQVTPRGAPRFRWIHNSFPGKLHGISVNLKKRISFQPKSKWLVKRIVPLFLTPNLYFHLKNMKCSAALSMFLIWRENLLSYDNMRGFFSHAQEVKGMWFFMKKIFTKFCLTY